MSKKLKNLDEYTKFNEATGWKPEVMPEEGVTRLIEWINKNMNLFSVSN